jgi:hypothetical protein
MTKGWLPYANIAIAHTPLMLIDLSLFYKIFGVGIIQLKLFTWGLILISDWLVFVIAKKLWNTKTAIFALGTFVVWNLFYDGNGLWFDLYMGVLALCSFYFAREKKWVWTGIFWALAMISKQTAVWFLLPIGLGVLQSVKHKVQSVGRLILGAFMVSVAFLLLLLAFHLLPSFWNWAIGFGIFELPRAVGQIQLPDLKVLMVAVFPFLIFIPLLLKTGKKYLYLLVWAIAGSLGAYPRFELFHFQAAIPFLAIASALVFAGKKNWSKFIKTGILIYIIGTVYLFAGFFMRNFKEGTRFYEKDVASVVSFVKYNTSPGDAIFVLNWWDNIYALTSTIPSTNPWVPQLSWYTEVPGIQEKMVEGLKANPPKFIILSPYSEIGLSAYTPEKVYEFVTENYKVSQRVDGVEILIQK